MIKWDCSYGNVIEKATGTRSLWRYSGGCSLLFLSSYLCSVSEKLCFLPFLQGRRILEKLHLQSCIFSDSKHHCRANGRPKRYWRLNALCKCRMNHESCHNLSSAKTIQWSQLLWDTPTHSSTQPLKLTSRDVSRLRCCFFFFLFFCRNQILSEIDITLI